MREWSPRELLEVVALDRVVPDERSASEPGRYEVQTFEELGLSRFAVEDTARGGRGGV
jgi:hypothetical protein